MLRSHPCFHVRATEPHFAHQQLLYMRQAGAQKAYMVNLGVSSGVLREPMRYGKPHLITIESILTLWPVL